VGDLVIDSARFEVSWKRNRVALTRAEFALLRALVHAPNVVLGREQLLVLARDDGAAATVRTVDHLSKRISQKVRAVDTSFDQIETVFGVGYRYRT
jgi:two-component system response regulator ChvI